ncbi:RnfH family protein [Salinisphaera sp.]|uniref:RnfH family protein n=1 Tax=Salinisphaera sp. TaxID=1914330 RepID=UPI002D78A9E2|nr:RnfH family protein [Salinisphaera sp.]HET7314349.1 RnfH family protein [Salinisphaera sp.]
MSDWPSKQVEVVFALPGRCWRETVVVAADATAETVARASGLEQLCREQCGGAPAAYGVFGRKIDAREIVGDGQRLELYRPLTADPRERRRRRAKYKN